MSSSRDAGASSPGKAKGHTPGNLEFQCKAPRVRFAYQGYALRLHSRQPRLGIVDREHDLIVLPEFFQFQPPFYCIKIETHILSWF